MYVVEINRISDRVMAVVIIYGKKVVKIFCLYPTMWKIDE